MNIRSLNHRVIQSRQSLSMFIIVNLLIYVDRSTSFSRNMANKKPEILERSHAEDRRHENYNQIIIDPCFLLRRLANKVLFK